MTLAMIAVPVILTMLARNDLGEARFYGTLQTAAIVLVPVSYTHLTLPTSDLV